jgi:uncharacterized protein YndB with AHSA1/START domain
MNIQSQRRHAARPAEPYATYDAPATLRIERLLPGPVERVWSYLVDSEKRAKWFAGGPLEPRPAGTITLSFRNSDLSGGEAGPHGPAPDGVDHVMHGVVTRCEPPHVLAFSWSPDGTATESVFELTPEGGDTRLVITQKRVSSRKQMVSMSAGWHTHLGLLIDILSGEPPRNFWREDTALVRRYEEIVGQ